MASRTGARWKLHGAAAADLEAMAQWVLGAGAAQGVAWMARRDLEKRGLVPPPWQGLKQKNREGTRGRFSTGLRLEAAQRRGQVWKAFRGFLKVAHGARSFWRDRGVMALVSVLLLQISCATVGIDTQGLAIKHPPIG